MKPLKDRDQASVGAVTLVLLALALLVAFNADDLPIIGGGTTYTAEFSEAAGLRPGNEVRVAGVKVGDGARRGAGARQGASSTSGSKDVCLGDESTRVHQDQDAARRQVPRARPPPGAAPQSPNDTIPLRPHAHAVRHRAGGRRARRHGRARSTPTSSRRASRSSPTRSRTARSTCATALNGLTRAVEDDVLARRAARDAAVEHGRQCRRRWPTGTTSCRSCSPTASLLLDELQRAPRGGGHPADRHHRARRRAVRPGRGQPAPAAARRWTSSTGSPRSCSATRTT